MERQMQENICLCKDCGNLDYAKWMCKKCGSRNLEMAMGNVFMGMGTHITWMKYIFEQQLFDEKDE